MIEVPGGKAFEVERDFAGLFGEDADAAEGGGIGFGAEAAEEGPDTAGEGGGVGGADAVGGKDAAFFVGEACLGMEGVPEVGGEAEFLQQVQFVPEEEGGGDVGLGAAVEGAAAEVVEGFADGGGGGDAVEEVGDAGGGGAAAPVLAEGAAAAEGAAFLEVVEVLAGVAVEEELAGVEEVELAEGPAFGALGAFDQGGDAAVVAGEPDDDAGGVGDGVPAENEGFIAEDGVMRQAHRVR